MNACSTVSLLAGCLLFAGCSEEPTSVPPSIQPVAYAQSLTNGSYEIQLRYSITSSGGPCLNKNSFKTWTSYETNWVYVRLLEGVQTPDQIVVMAGTKDENGDHTFPIEGLQGKVSFDKKTLTIDLQHPRLLPNGLTQGCKPYRLNGTYQIVESN